MDSFSKNTTFKVKIIFFCCGTNKWNLNENLEQQASLSCWLIFIEYLRGCFRRGIADKERVSTPRRSLGITSEGCLITISIKVLGSGIPGREDGLGIVEDGSIVPRHSRKIFPGFVHQQSGGLIAPLSNEALYEIPIKYILK